jgi:hypothetical protein
MTNHFWHLILALGLCVWIAYDMTKAIRTGKAGATRYRFGVITRRGRPDAFRRYVIADAIGLALCLGLVIWAAFGH